MEKGRVREKMEEGKGGVGRQERGRDSERSGEVEGEEQGETDGEREKEKNSWSMHECVRTVAFASLCFFTIVFNYNF